LIQLAVVARRVVSAGLTTRRSLNHCGLIAGDGSFPVAVETIENGFLFASGGDFLADDLVNFFVRQDEPGRFGLARTTSSSNVLTRLACCKDVLAGTR
jgi:hypothetical protein